MQEKDILSLTKYLLFFFVFSFDCLCAYLEEESDKRTESAKHQLKSVPKSASKPSSAAPSPIIDLFGFHTDSKPVSAAKPVSAHVSSPTSAANSISANKPANAVIHDFVTGGPAVNTRATDHNSAAPSLDDLFGTPTHIQSNEQNNSKSTSNAQQQSKQKSAEPNSANDFSFDFSGSASLSVKHPPSVLPQSNSTPSLAHQYNQRTAQSQPVSKPASKHTSGVHDLDPFAFYQSDPNVTTH